jgi:uncharacterized protein YdhG (YjbR/CyaY superfamily)
VPTEESKMDKPASVEDYLAGLPEESRAALERLRQVIRAAVPEATEGIAWQMPAFRAHDRWLVGYAAFRDHCSFFPMSTRVLEAFAAELEPYSTSKGTIRFSTDHPLPAALVKKMVKARLEEAASSRGR